MRSKRRQLRRTRHLSTTVAPEQHFLVWLNAALRDERWRTVIRERLTQVELAEIKF